MATTLSPPAAITRHVHRLNVARLLVTGSVTAGVIYVLCWLGTFIPFSSPTHAYISLFTTKPVASSGALMEGAIWSLLFGAISGALFAMTYNGTSSLDRE